MRHASGPIHVTSTGQTVKLWQQMQANVPQPNAQQPQQAEAISRRRIAGLHQGSRASGMHSRQQRKRVGHEPPRGRPQQ